MTATPTPGASMTTTQSVVVPLDDWRHVIGALKNAMARLPMGAAIGNVTDALSKVEHLQAAPAPSSLAGGEVVSQLAAQLARSIAGLGYPVGLGQAPTEVDCTKAAQGIVAIYAAALSPEAPAREGVKYAVTSEYAVGITEHDPALTPRHEAPAEPVSDRYKFDDEIAWLREAARYFSARDTKGEDRAHWANVFNAENATRLASRLAELSSNTCQLEAPAEGAGDLTIERVLSRICDAQKQHYGNATALHLAMLDLCIDGRAALALRARSSAPEAREGDA